ncbi:deleted in malignant brain tumors 1 protein-like isoform X3 [Saccostrea cucullata]|uniref:deleted in malignant brain tumors 1 protein-like isoform X3 n=1 Tax=Saccostrea cuccullata TaxID=36930 RepID=UPI002ED25A9D
MDICKLLGFVLSIVAVENQSTTSKSSFSVRGLSAMVRAHNTEIKIMKQQILEQKRLIESLQKQVEAGSLKPKIRLVNGNSSREGRVEVYKDGVWGTVCDDIWGFNHADVVCKQLFGLVGIPYSNAYFGPGTGLILMSNVRCSGTENSLLDCGHTDELNLGCSHSEDAGVMCMKAPRVRLSKQKDFQGRVEVYKNNRWGTICGRNWDYRDASVICRSLGYSERGLVVLNSVFGGGTGTIHLNDVQCSGKETGLFNCTYSETSSCSHSEVAGAICILPSHKTRIVNGSSPDEGRVDVLVNNRWRRVCNNGWGSSDATVACRSLGFMGGFSVSLPTIGDQKTENWFLNQMYCNGNEDSLLKCARSITTSCSSEAGVLCYKTLNSTVRLVNGSSPDEGRVEVLVNSRWRPVCSSSWDNNDARVACRSLGYLRGFSFSLPTTVSRRKDKWFLYIMECSGNEDSLLRCANSVSTSCSYESRVMCYQPLNSKC